MDMKKLFLLLAFLTIFIHGDAKKRNIDELKEIASSFFNQHGINRSRRVQVQTNDIAVPLTKEQIAIVTNGNNGFVVIAIDGDIEKPILGYSESKFENDNLPPAFQWWMDAINESLSKEDNISCLRRNIQLPDGFPDHINPLVTTEWNQWSPYNDKIPLYILNTSNSSRKRAKSIITPPDNNEKDSTKCPTGCVATAMAQIMNYHKYPDHGELRHAVAMEHGDGTISFVGVDFENTFFDWGSMIDKYTYTYSWDYDLVQSVKTPNFSGAQGDAIATLMLACGVSCDTNYKPDGSGATLPNAAKAFRVFFKYNSVYLTRGSVNDDIWMKRIYKFINLKLPILYSGSGNGSHAFIIDGYDENGDVHINWGWGGSSNGYFNINALNPPKNENENFNFSSNQSMVLVRPSTYTIDVKEVEVSQPGTLSTLIPESDYEFVDGLKVIGNINGSDIIVLRKMCGKNVGRWSSNTGYTLDWLDLSDANIVEGGDCYNEYYNGYTKNNIFPKGSFASCDGLCNIILPNSIESIDDDAFNCCENLQSIIIPRKVSTIGIRAFANCSSIRSVTIPPGVKKFDTFAFSGCSGVDSVFIDDLESWCNIDRGFDGEASPLYNGARLYVSGNELEDLVVPTNVTTIQPGTFYGCESLRTIQLHNGISEISPYLFKGCTGLTNITIPGHIKKIGYDAFANCVGLKNVTIEEGVVELGGQVFLNDSNMVAISIPKTVSNIGYYAFFRCNSLNAVHIEDLESWCKVNFGVYSGETYANPLHLGSSLYIEDIIQKDIEIPANIEQINYLAFYGCGSIESVSFHDKVKEIGRQSFSGCPNLKNVYFSEGIKQIDASAFANDSNLVSVEFPQTLLGIGPKAFYGCTSLKEVVIPSKVKSLGSEYDYTCGYNVFAGCNGLNSIVVEEGNSMYDSRNNCNAIIETKSNKIITGCVGTTIPNDITEIGNYAFLDISNLHYLSIPNNITRLGTRAFKNCDLKKVWSYIEEPYQIYDVFGYDQNGNRRNTTATLYVPVGTKSKYEQLWDWYNFPNIEEFDPAGINNVITEDDKVIAIYDINGQRATNLKKGIKIIKYKNGTIKKIYVK